MQCLKINFDKKKVQRCPETTHRILLGFSLACSHQKILVCYGNDLCFIALSSSGMQQLLVLCDLYATHHQLSYNATQLLFLCFKPN